MRKFGATRASSASKPWGDPAISAGRAIRFRGVVQIPDVLEDPTLIKDVGFRSVLTIPMLQKNEPIGVIAVGRDQPGPDRQIALLQTFADQAVIAIENTRLFEKVQQKNVALNATNTRTADGD